MTFKHFCHECAIYFVKAKDFIIHRNEHNLKEERRKSQERHPSWPH